MNFQSMTIKEYLNILQTATVEDCLDMYEMRDMTTVINDGQIIGFKKE